MMLLNDERGSGFGRAQVFTHVCMILIFSHIVLKYVILGKESLDVYFKSN